MRILFACIPTPYNRFMADLKIGLERHAEVVWDCNEFWACNNHYDIVHIHWPEYLSHEVESYLRNTKPLPAELWDRIISSFEHWSKHSTIVYTRHVQEPHARNDSEFQRLYKISMSYCKAVAHFANFSIQQFKDFYPELKNIKHTVIPHHNYASLPNTISRTEARKYLKINRTAKVMLIFGSIKENEKELIEEAFSYIPGNNKVLIAPAWKIHRYKIKWIRLREWVYKLQLILAKINDMKKINLGIIPEDEAQYYCNSADFLFIPRTYELNSGNITFGFTFGLVVVGKDSADIGEILLETNNPTFKVGDSDSLKKSIRRAIELSEGGHGKQNKLLALKEWDTYKVANQYINMFKNAIPNS